MYSSSYNFRVLEDRYTAFGDNLSRVGELRCGGTTRVYLDHPTATRVSPGSARARDNIGRQVLGKLGTFLHHINHINIDTVIARWLHRHQQATVAAESSTQDKASISRSLKIFRTRKTNSDHPAGTRLREDNRNNRFTRSQRSTPCVVSAPGEYRSCN